MVFFDVWDFIDVHSMGMEIVKYDYKTVENLWIKHIGGVTTPELAREAGTGKATISYWFSRYLRERKVKNKVE